MILGVWAYNEQLGLFYQCMLGDDEMIMKFHLGSMY